MLLEYGAVVDAINDSGESPMDMAGPKKQKFARIVAKASTTKKTAGIKVEVTSDGASSRHDKPVSSAMFGSPVKVMGDHPLGGM